MMRATAKPEADGWTIVMPTAMTSRITGQQTVVFVSHMAEQVKDMCDRVIWLDKGRIAAEGNSIEVTDAYTRHITEARRAGLQEQQKKIEQL